MADGNPLRSFFESPACPTPSPDDATTAASRGGFVMDEGASAGLVGTPFEHPIVSPPGQKETANSSGLPPVISLTDVKDGPAAGTQIGVDPGVASPAVAATPIITK